MSRALLRRPRHGSRLRIKAFNLFLKGLDLVPGFQAAAHDTKIELFHEDEILVHIKEDVSSNLLLFKDVAMFAVDANISKALCGFMLVPGSHLFLGRLTFFLFVRLVTIDVGHAMTKVAAVLALGIVSHPGFWGRETMSWGTQVGNMLIDDAQGLVHHRTVLTIHLMRDRLFKRLLNVESHIPSRQRRGARSLLLLLLGRGGCRRIDVRYLHTGGADMARSLRGRLSTFRRKRRT